MMERIEVYIVTESYAGYEVPHGRIVAPVPAILEKIGDLESTGRYERVFAVAEVKF